MATDKPTVRIALSISSRPGRPATEQPTYRGAKIAVDKLQADSDFPVDIEWEVFDDDGDTEVTKEYAHEIVDDESFVGVVGPMGSSEALANAPIFSEAGIAQISPCGSHPDLTDYETFYRLVANEDVQGHELARISQEYVESDDVAVIYTDDDWGNSVADIYTREYENLGGNVVLSEPYAVGEDSNVDELAEHALKADPDMVFLVVHANEGRKISSALRDAGVSVPFLGTDAMKPQFPLGGGDGDKVYHTHAGADFERLPSASEFREEYVDRYPPDSTYSPEAYDAVMILAEGIRRAETPTRENVLMEVEAMDSYEGVSGTVEFGEDGERTNAFIGLYRVILAEEGRELEYLGTTNEIL